MHRSFSRLTAGLLRITAAVLLVCLLAGVPVAVVAAMGWPDPGQWSFDAVGRLDEHLVADVGAVVFLLLWAWFAITAVGECVNVIRWRRRETTLAPPAPGPTGWVRRLVRVALVSSIALVAAGGGRLIGPVAAAAPTGLAWQATEPPAARIGNLVPGDAPGAASASSPSLTATFTADGRSTPYSLAVALGDPTWRDRIIELNLGAPAPDGSTWTGGVFPEGMSVTLPSGAALPDDDHWRRHEVVAGDSVYGMAESLCEHQLACVGEVVDAILDRNLGDTMPGGRTFDEPALIVVGWQLDVPGTDGRHDDHPTQSAEVVVEPSPVAPDASAPAPVETAPVTTAPVETPPATTAPVETTPVTSPPVETTPVTSPPGIASSAPTPPEEVVITTVEQPSRTPLTTSLGAAVLLCAGALGLLESRRRHQLRRAGAHTTSMPPGPQAVSTERLLRALDRTTTAVRIDLALRCLGHHLLGSGRHVVAVLLDTAGDLTAVLDAPTSSPPPTPFTAIDERRWHLPAAVDHLALDDRTRRTGQPCPALVHLGSARCHEGSGMGELFIDLEAFGLLAVDGPAEHTRQVLTALAASLAASPVGESVRVVTHGLDTAAHLGNLSAESAESLDDALDRAASLLGATATVAAGRRTFELRARGTGGEAWEPVVVVSNGDHEARAHGEADGAVRVDREPVDRELVELTRGGGRGLAVVVGHAVTGAGLTLRADRAGWHLDMLELDVVPIGLSDEQVHEVHELLDAADRPLPIATPHRGAPIVSALPGTPVENHAPFAEPPWAFMVRLLGPVGVITHTGEQVTFERGKALELLAWLSLHREHPARSAARAALWDVEVRHATFANVVSDARRTLARAVEPVVGEEWVERTLTDLLPLHPAVLTDADLLRQRLHAARQLSPAEAVEVLRPGVALIRDLPFAGSDYLWPHAEGSTSSLTLLATAAATELAQHHLDLGDIDGVFWATGQGLRVLSGHEELIALRMRAFAERGDLAGVRHEWEIYERSLLADSWSLGEPSPKLVAIRRELLSR